MKTINVLCLFSFIIPVSLMLASCGTETSDPSAGNTTTSIAGSTASMLPHKNALFVLDSFKLKVLDTSSADSTPTVFEKTVAGAEALFVYDGYLYVAGIFGVRIFDIADPHKPIEATFYGHARGCDPVIVNDKIGYITVRSRFDCEGESNYLEIADFSDPTTPVSIAEFDMDYPFGLAHTGEFVAICQPGFGLTLVAPNIDKSSTPITAAPEEVARYQSVDCFDLIHHNDILFATATDGIYQFRLDDMYLQNISTIPVGVSDTE